MKVHESGRASDHSENTTPATEAPTRLSWLSEPRTCQVEPLPKVTFISLSLNRGLRAG